MSDEQEIWQIWQTTTYEARNATNTLETVRYGSIAANLDSKISGRYAVNEAER